MPLEHATTGGGVFSDINSETPIYTPSTPEEAANLVSLIVTVTDPDAAGPCLDVVETVETVSYTHLTLPTILLV